MTKARPFLQAPKRPPRKFTDNQSLQHFTDGLAPVHGSNIGLKRSCDLRVGPDVGFGLAPPGSIAGVGLRYTKPRNTLGTPLDGWLADVPLV